MVIDIYLHCIDKICIKKEIKLNRYKYNEAYLMVMYFSLLYNCSEMQNKLSSKVAMNLA